jgi:hypothetical protein
MPFVAMHTFAHAGIFLLNPTVHGVKPTRVRSNSMPVAWREANMRMIRSIIVPVWCSLSYLYFGAPLKVKRKGLDNWTSRRVLEGDGGGGAATAQSSSDATLHGARFRQKSMLEECH